MTTRHQGRRPGRRLALPAVLAGLALGAIGCSSASAPEVPVGPDGTADAALVEGRDIYTRRCASCHGASGGGSRGPKLSEGQVLEDFPDVEEQIALVADGRGGMPSFADVLEPSEIEAVVRYTREVLAVG
jgi:mono/diheme cytochrome c family protein